MIEGARSVGLLLNGVLPFIAHCNVFLQGHFLLLLCRSPTSSIAYSQRKGQQSIIPCAMQMLNACASVAASSSLAINAAC